MLYYQWYSSGELPKAFLGCFQISESSSFQAKPIPSISWRPEQKGFFYYIWGIRRFVLAPFINPDESDDRLIDPYNYYGDDCLISVFCLLLLEFDSYDPI